MFGFNKNKKVKKSGIRRYEAAQNSRLSQWPALMSSGAEDISSTGKMRDKARYLARNNDYVKRYHNLIKTHVVGPSGVLLQCLFKNAKGDLDTSVNDMIETAFKKWAKKPEVTGKNKWPELQRLIINTVARDGEAVIRFVYGTKHNDFNFSLQLIDASALDDCLTKELPSGNEIKGGIECDEWGAPVFYYFKTTKNGKNVEYFEGVQYLKIPAQEILHIFISEESNQMRGVPWTHTSIERLKMLQGYEQAELVASRVASSKMGFFTQEDEAEQSYDGDDDERDDSGNVIAEAHPGSFEMLPKGIDFKPWNPEHPAGNYMPFVKTTLRGIAAGLNVSYNSLAVDLEGVNFSSLRSGLLEERDFYKQVQQWFIDAFMRPVFERWLKMAILSGQLEIPMKKLAMYLEPMFLPRRWAWVDPLKENKANVEAINSGTKSRTEVAAEQGRSIEDILAELAREDKLIEKYNLNVSRDNFQKKEALTNGESK